MNAELEQIRSDAMAWVQRAGMLARDLMGHAVVSRKADTSVVTNADHAVQDLLLQTIAQRYPDDAVISEETQADPQRHASVATAGRCWIIDPIDGTRNYTRSIPMFTVSVALFEHGSPIVGLVYNPMTDQMYSATAGGGAWLNRNPIHVTETPPTGDYFVGLPSGREEPLPSAAHRWIDRMVFRATGSTALNLALLASGCLDAVFASKCKLWDMAAGALILEEAGATITDHRGRRYFPFDLAGYHSEKTPFLAAKPGFLRELLDELARSQ